MNPPQTAPVRTELDLVLPFPVIGPVASAERRLLLEQARQR